MGGGCYEGFVFLSGLFLCVVGDYFCCVAVE